MFPPLGETKSKNVSMHLCSAAISARLSLPTWELLWVWILDWLDDQHRFTGWLPVVCVYMDPFKYSKPFYYCDGSGSLQAGAMKHSWDSVAVPVQRLLRKEPGNIMPSKLILSRIYIQHYLNNSVKLGALGRFGRLWRIWHWICCISSPFLSVSFSELHNEGKHRK